MEAAYPGWQSRLAHRRRMVVAGRVGAVESPSQTWQERPAIRQGEGVFLAGDMVAAPGVLSEIAFASGQEAGALAASWATTAER